MVKIDMSINNKKIKRLVNISILISFILCLSGIMIVRIYNTYYISMYLLQTGIETFRCGLVLGSFSFMFGIFFDKYLQYR